MSRLIAIDPGDRWTGVAFFEQTDKGHWFCDGASEFGREEFEDAFAELLLVDHDTPEYVIFEKFRLYADKAKTQTGSEFDTAQIIGVIKYLTRVHNEHAAKHDEVEKIGRFLTCELEGHPCEDPLRRPKPIELVKQPADIKKPITGILRHKKIKSVTKPISKEYYGGRDHVVDAELHGWYYILKVLEGGA